MIQGVHHDNLAGYVADEHIDWKKNTDTVPVLSATHTLYIGYNCSYDNGWKRTVAVKEAVMLGFHASDGSFKIWVQTDANNTIGSAITWSNVVTFDNDGNLDVPTISITNIKSGATQGAAGAATGEVWLTNGHATLPDGVLMLDT